MEKDPVEVEGQAKPRRRRYSWGSLEAPQGTKLDGFFIPGIDSRSLSSSRAFAQKKYPDRRFRTVTRVLGGVKGVRVWRVR